MPISSLSNGYGPVSATDRGDRVVAHMHGVPVTLTDDGDTVRLSHRADLAWSGEPDVGALERAVAAVTLARPGLTQATVHEGGSSLSIDQWVPGDTGGHGLAVAVRDLVATVGAVAARADETGVTFVPVAPEEDEDPTPAEPDYPQTIDGRQALGADEDTADEVAEDAPTEDGSFDAEPADDADTDDVVTGDTTDDGLVGATGAAAAATGGAALGAASGLGTDDGTATHDDVPAIDEAPAADVGTDDTPSEDVLDVDEPAEPDVAVDEQAVPADEPVVPAHEPVAAGDDPVVTDESAEVVGDAALTEDDSAHLTEPTTRLEAAEVEAETAASGWGDQQTTSDDGGWGNVSADTPVGETAADDAAGAAAAGAAAAGAGAAAAGAATGAGSSWGSATDDVATSDAPVGDAGVGEVETTSEDSTTAFESVADTPSDDLVAADTGADQPDEAETTTAEPAPPVQETVWGYVHETVEVRGLTETDTVVGQLVPGQWYAIMQTGNGWAHVISADGSLEGWADDRRLIRNT